MPGPSFAQDVTPSPIAIPWMHSSWGRDLERTVLARAIWLHIQRKVLSYDNRTVVLTDPAAL